jgi:tRNA(fMet)-specific endonuclease VapC
VPPRFLLASDIYIFAVKRRTPALLRRLDQRATATAISVVSYGELAFGEIRAQLQRTGQPIGSNDLSIAAHALADDLTLITNNEREFQRVPGLRVENWAR